MANTHEQRLEIAKTIIENDITIKEASKMFKISTCTVTNYLAAYKEKYGISKSNKCGKALVVSNENKKEDRSQLTIEDYEDLLLKSRIENERLKKGYQVKGGGQARQFIVFSKKSST